MAVPRNTQLIDGLSSDFRKLYDPAHAFADAVSMLKMFPGIRGIWPSSVVGDTGQMVDVSGNGLHLTNTNNALIGYTSNTLIPRALYNGSTQYHTRADSAYFDITGTESYIDQNGLTIGAWVKFDTAASTTEMIISKWLGSNLSYNINRTATGELRFSITNNGTTAVLIDTTDIMLLDTWYFVCGRFTPSAELMAQINGTQVVNTTSIPASIFSGTSVFRLAADGGGGALLDGRISLAFLCASALSDAHINTFYQFTAPLFGVTL